MDMNTYPFHYLLLAQLFITDLPVFYVFIQIMVMMSSTVDLNAQKPPATEESWSLLMSCKHTQIKFKKNPIFKDLSTTSSESLTSQ